VEQIVAAILTVVMMRALIMSVKTAALLNVTAEQGKNQYALALNLHNVQGRLVDSV
jgi:hypothetical protein